MQLRWSASAWAWPGERFSPTIAIGMEGVWISILIVTEMLTETEMWIAIRRATAQIILLAIGQAIRVVAQANSNGSRIKAGYGKVVQARAREKREAGVRAEPDPRPELLDHALQPARWVLALQQEPLARVLQLEALVPGLQPGMLARVPRLERLAPVHRRAILPLGLLLQGARVRTAIAHLPAAHSTGVGVATTRDPPVLGDGQVVAVGAADEEEAGGDKHRNNFRTIFVNHEYCRNI